MRLCSAVIKALSLYCAVTRMKGMMQRSGMAGTIACLKFTGSLSWRGCQAMLMFPGPSSTVAGPESVMLPERANEKSFENMLRWDTLLASSSSR